LVLLVLITVFPIAIAYYNYGSDQNTIPIFINVLWISYVITLKKGSKTEKWPLSIIKVIYSTGYITTNLVF
jgi:hypothetical protein